MTLCQERKTKDETEDTDRIENLKETNMHISARVNIVLQAER